MPGSAGSWRPRDGCLAAVVPVGKPVKQLTRLTRATVDELTHLERWDGGPLQV